MKAIFRKPWTGTCCGWCSRLNGRSCQPACGDRLKPRKCAEGSQRRSTRLSGQKGSIWQRSQRPEWERYPVFLDTTLCHIGGERHWFLCPARGCGRRVAILYGGGWGKPEGMHWRTYERLCREHDALSDRTLVGIMDHLGHLSGCF